MNVTTRHKIIGVEVIGLGVFLMALILLELLEVKGNQVVQNFAWACGIVGITLVLVGLEILSLAKQLPVPMKQSSA